MRLCSGVVTWAALMGLALFPSLLLADSFRCGTYLIREGILAADVIARCGEPTSVSSVTEPVLARRSDGTTYQVGTTTKEFWIYDRGSRLFPVRLTIEKGVAEIIELLSRN